MFYQRFRWGKGVVCGLEDCGGDLCTHEDGMILVSGRSEVGLVDARRDLDLRGRRRPVRDRRDGAPRGDVPRLGVAVDRLCWRGGSRWAVAAAAAEAAAAASHTAQSRPRPWSQNTTLTPLSTQATHRRTARAAHCFLPKSTRLLILPQALQVFEFSNPLVSGAINSLVFGPCASASPQEWPRARQTA